MNLPKLFVAVLLLLPSVALRAQTSSDTGFYAGASLGGTKFAFSNIHSFTSQPGMTVRDDHLSWKVNAGYQISPTWGIEAGYANLGACLSGVILWSRLRFPTREPSSPRP